MILSDGLSKVTGYLNTKGPSPKRSPSAIAFRGGIEKPPRRQIDFTVAGCEIFRIAPIFFHAIADFADTSDRVMGLRCPPDGVNCECSAYPNPIGLVILVNWFVGPNFPISLRIDPSSVAIIRHDQISLFGSATAIVSAWTSRPTKRIVDMRTISFVCGFAPPDFNSAR